MKLRSITILHILCLVVIFPHTANSQSSTFDLTTALAAAKAGDTIRVPAGTYRGPILLDKAITLIGEGKPVLDGGGKGDVVLITAPGVTLRGFIIRGSGDSLDHEDSGVRVKAANTLIEENEIDDSLFGIYLAQSPNSTVRNNLIIGKKLAISRRGDSLKIWYSHHALVEGNTIRQGRDTVIWFSPDTVIRKNVMEYNRYGLHLMSTQRQVIEQNILRHNSVGVYIMYGSDFTLRNNLILDNRGPSGYAIGLKDVDNVEATGNRMVNNRVGLYADNAPVNAKATVRFERNLFAYNEIGVLLLPDVQRNTYSHNIFLDNDEQVGISGGGRLQGNFWASNGQGNFWSDYAGFDANGDQIGDLPYRAQSLYEDLMEQYPALRLFQLSPATAALDLAAKAFPIFQPQPKLQDPNPLVAPPTLPAVPGIPQPPVASNLLIASGMVGMALAVLRMGRRVTR